MVYQARLESVCSRKVTVGSNPTLSASIFLLNPGHSYNCEFLDIPSVTIDLYLFVDKVCYNNSFVMTSTNKELRYWVGFNIVPGIGRVKFSQLETYFGNLEKAWKAGPADLKQAGLDSNTIKAIESCRPQIDLDSRWRSWKETESEP